MELKAIERTDAVRVSPISFFDIGQKVRLGKWRHMEPHVGALPEMMAGQGALHASLTVDMALLASQFDWAHRDPFDRLPAATAILSDATFLSADTMFETLHDPRLRRVW